MIAHQHVYQMQRSLSMSVSQGTPSPTHPQGDHSMPGNIKDGGMDTCSGVPLTLGESPRKRRCPKQKHVHTRGTHRTSSAFVVRCNGESHHS